MKSKFIAIALLLSLSLTSCDAVDDLLSFSISNEASIKIKSSSPINLPSEIITPEVTTNSSAEFENNKTKANLVKDVHIKSLYGKKVTLPNHSFLFYYFALWVCI